MRELWSVIGPGFVLPISVVWKTDQTAVVRTGCGLALLGCQREALAEVLNQHGKAIQNTWEIEREALEAIAKPCGHEDPERVVHWIPREKLVVEFEDAAPKDHKNRYCMLAYMVQWGVFRSIPEADICWHQFMRAALNTILRDRRPVDLIFCTVRDVPYRPDWCNQILTARHYLGATFCWDERSRATLLKRKGDQPTPRQYEDAFAWFYRAEPLFGWSDKEAVKGREPMVVQRSLHVQANDGWREASYEVERERNVGPPPIYFYALMRECQARKEELHDLYRSWLKEIFTPTRNFPPTPHFHPPVYCEVHNRTRKGESAQDRQTKWEVTRRWQKRVRAVAWPMLDRIQDSLAPDGVEPCETPPGYRDRSLQNMQPLPDLRPAASELRDAGPDVEAPLNGPGESAGMLVPDAAGRYSA